MFDFFHSLETGAPGEVEMVSLVPDFEEETLEVEDMQETEEEVSKVEEDLLKIEEEISKMEEENPEMKDKIPEVDEFVLDTRKERKHENIAMSRSYTRDGVVTEIAYINYNKVRITKGDAMPIIKEFATTKEAVDYYVEQMQELGSDG